MVDYHGKLVTSNGDQLQFTLVLLDGSTGVLSPPRSARPKVRRKK